MVSTGRCNRGVEDLRWRAPAERGSSRRAIACDQGDLSGKALVPFITHGGYGFGSSLAVVVEHAPGARLAKEFSKECDQERESLRQVTEWLARGEVAR